MKGSFGSRPRLQDCDSWTVCFFNGSRVHARSWSLTARAASVGGIDRGKDLDVVEVADLSDGPGPLRQPGGEPAGFNPRRNSMFPRERRRCIII